MSRDLYRREALQFASQNKLGSVVNTQPLSAKLLTTLVLVITAITAVYLWQGEYARKETVLGYLEPESGVAYVYPRVGGVVNSVFVQEGQTVKAGQRLISLSFKETLEDGVDALNVQIREYVTQLEYLNERLDRTRDLFESEFARLDQKIRETNIEKEKLAQILVLQKKSARVVFELLETARSLGSSGALPRSQILQMTAEAYDKEKEVVQIEQALLKLDAVLVDLRHEVTQLPQNKRNALAQIQLEISKTEQRIAEARKNQDQVLTAAIDGRIGIVQANPGQFATAGVPLLSIVPPDQKLVAVLLIPTSSIGFVSRGQEIRLKFEAFPHQQFGTYPALLTQVSNSIVAQAQLYGPIRVDNPVYVARGALQSSAISVLGEERPLQAGMLLKADIILEKRSLLNWLLEPLYSLRGRRT